MEQDTRKLVRYILWGFAIFLILLSVLLLVISYFDLYILFKDIGRSFIGFLPKIIGIILIIVITKLLLSIFRPTFNKVFDGHRRSHAEVKMMWQLFANIIWIFIMLLLIFIIIGDFTGLLTFGVIVAALLWVMQRPILNIAGWLDIIFHRPYSIGDRIEIDGKKGYVIDVGMFHTTIREFGEWMEGDTFTGRLISVPNSSVFETPIINYTRDTPYVWDEVKVSITYESNHDRAKQHIYKSAFEVVGNNMKKYSNIMAQKMEIKELRRQLIEEPVVRMEFSESCFNFYVVYLCEASQRRAIRSEITERILDKIKKDDKVRIAYPHMEVVGVGKQ